MILIEFSENLTEKQNLIKYKEELTDDWNYIYLDFNILCLLVQNFGIISTKKMPNVFINADNPSTSSIFNVNYCGANVTLYCGNINKAKFYLPNIEDAPNIHH